MELAGGAFLAQALAGICVGRWLPGLRVKGCDALVDDWDGAHSLLTLWTAFTSLQFLNPVLRRVRQVLRARHLVPLIALKHRLRLLEDPRGRTLTPLHAVVVRRGSVLAIYIWLLSRLSLMRSVVVLQEIVHIELRLRVSEFAFLLQVRVAIVRLILAHPTFNMLALVAGHGFGSASRGPQGHSVLRVLALLRPLEIDFTCRYLRCHVSLSDLSDPLSAVEAAPHADNHVVIVHHLVTLCVRQLLIIMSIKGLRANISVELHSVSVLVRVVSVRSASLLVLLRTANDHARVGVDDSLAGRHTVEVLGDVPCVALLDVEPLMRTYNRLLNSCLSLLSLVL